MEPLFAQETFHFVDRKWQTSELALWKVGGKTSKAPKRNNAGTIAAGNSEWDSEWIHLWDQYSHHQYSYLHAIGTNRLVLYLAVKRNTPFIRLCIGVNQDEITVEEKEAIDDSQSREIYVALSYLVSIRISTSSQRERRKQVRRRSWYQLDNHSRRLENRGGWRRVPSRHVNDSRFLFLVWVFSCSNILPENWFVGPLDSYSITRSNGKWKSILTKLCEQYQIANPSCRIEL